MSLKVGVGVGHIFKKISVFITFIQVPYLDFKLICLDSLNPITDFKMPYYDIKLSYPDIIMPCVLHCYGRI